MSRPRMRASRWPAPRCPVAFKVAFTVAVTLALSAFRPGATLASAPELLGFGVRAPAMAGTGVAIADDFEAVYQNPAGLALARRPRITLGYLGASYRFSLDGEPRSVESTSALLLGAELPLPLGGALAHRIALGLGLHLPTNLVNRALAPLPDVPVLLHESRTQTVSVMAVAAVRLPAGLSLGAGVLALAALVGGVDLLGEAGGRFGATSDEQLIASYAALAGARWDARTWLHLGAAYRGESLSRYDIRVDNHLGGALPFALPVLRIAGISQYDPHAVAIEAALGHPREGAIVAVQLEWQHWSAMPARTEAVTAGSPAPPPPGLRDTVTARLGVEWSRTSGAVSTSLRAGYGFVESPVPDASPTRTLLDADRHVASAGLGVAWSSRALALRADGFYQLHVLEHNARTGGWFAAAGVAIGVDL